MLLLMLTLAAGQLTPPTLAPPVAGSPAVAPAARGTGVAWSPTQATGPIDTPSAADAVTAWVSREADRGLEWLEVDFEREVSAVELRIRESYNPGTVVRVTTRQNNRDIELWAGHDPTAQAPADLVIKVPNQMKLSSVRIHLDTALVPGWNEIDAVELVGKDGTRQWASRARASSSYADVWQQNADPIAEAVGKNVRLKLMDGSEILGALRSNHTEVLVITEQKSQRELVVFKGRVLTLAVEP